MDDTIRNKIKKLTIYTKRLTQSSLTGDYLSAFKGSGLEFDQLREYLVGDDIRFIDWKSSAKMNKMMIKQFVEERDRVIILAIDISSSDFYSSGSELRRETIAQISAALTFVATHNKDKVGALFFSDQVEKWIPPKKGRAHFGKIIETLFSIEQETKEKKTNIAEAFRFLMRLKKRNAILFMISDWIDETESYKKLLKIANVKFDLVGIRILDSCEQKIPNFGLLKIKDPETSETTTIDTKTNINTFLNRRKIEQEKLFKRQKIDLLDLTIGQPFINKMIKFFHQRTRRQI